MKGIAIITGGIMMAGKAKRGKAGFGGINAKLFAQFADQRRFWRFASFDFTARKFP